MGPRGHPRMMMMMMPMMPRYDGIDGMITPGDEEGDDDGDDVDAEGNPDDAGGDDGSKPKPLMSIKMSAGVKAEFEAKVRSSESGRIAPLGMGMGPKFHPFLRHGLLRFFYLVFVSSSIQALTSIRLFRSTDLVYFFRGTPGSSALGSDGAGEDTASPICIGNI